MCVSCIPGTCRPSCAAAALPGNWQSAVSGRCRWWPCTGDSAAAGSLCCHGPERLAGTHSEVSAAGVMQGRPIGQFSAAAAQTALFGLGASGLQGWTSVRGRRPARARRFPHACCDSAARWTKKCSGILRHHERLTTCCRGSVCSTCGPGARTRATAAPPRRDQYSNCGLCQK
jgi:hypothetical protein